MRCPPCSLAALIAVTLLVSSVKADDAEDPGGALRDAVARAIPRLQQASAGSADQRKCFTCHNQAMPVLALAEARQRGFAIDEGNFKRQIQHTVDHLKRGRKNYLEGRGQGGRVITAGYALWTLEAGGWEADDLTAAVAGFLTEYQKDMKHWRHLGSRPPSSGSDFMSTYVALRGLSAFGTDEQRPKIEERTKLVREWLLSENPSQTEDRVFRLRALKYVDADQDVIRKAAAELIDSQQTGGGWAQTKDMESDAYATGTALVALLRTGSISKDDEKVRRGLQYLLEQQLDDGSWHVVSRAKPFQAYFESGFPHGKDQFISVAASSWATLALLLTLDESPDVE